MSRATRPIALAFSQHLDKHRPEHLVLLAVDQQLAEVPRSCVPPMTGIFALSRL